MPAAVSILKIKNILKVSICTFLPNFSNFFLKCIYINKECVSTQSRREWNIIFFLFTFTAYNRTHIHPSHSLTSTLFFLTAVRSVEGLHTELPSRESNSDHLTAARRTTGKITRAEIFKQSMGAVNRVGIGLSYRPTKLHSLAELIPWNRFLGSLKFLKFGLKFQPLP